MLIIRKFKEFDEFTTYAQLRFKFENSGQKFLQILKIQDNKI